MDFSITTGLLCVSLIVSLWSPLFSKETCAYFTFLSLNGTILTAKESRDVSIPFTLDTSGCSKALGKYRIIISKLYISSGLEGDYCTFLLNDGNCNLPFGQTGCECPGPTDSYYFTKTAIRNDNTEWIWRTSNGIANEQRIMISVT
ncbi:hypothetical protein BaRGS_00013321, partial [Batillaria attramentaria]